MIDPTIALFWLLERPERPSADLGAVLDAPPVESWSRRLPGPRFPAATHTERSRPAVAGERVYLGYASTEGLFVLDRRSGEVLETLESKAAVQAEAVPMLDGGVLFADTAGYTFRYDAEGEELWSHFGGAPVTARPTLADGRVFVGSVDDVLYALDAETGDLAWRYQRPDDPTRHSELTLFGAPSPVVAGDLLLAGFSDGATVALDASSGTTTWERRVGEGTYPDLIGTPVVADGDLYVGGFSEPLVSLDLDTKSVRWRVDAGTADASLVDGERLYHPGSDGRLRAIDRRTGATIWTWDSETSGALTTPQVTGAGLLLGSSDGGLYLVDSESGEATWELERWHLLQGITVAPVVVDDQILAVTNGGVLLSLVAPHPSATPTTDGDIGPLVP